MNPNNATPPTTDPEVDQSGPSGPSPRSASSRRALRSTARSVAKGTSSAGRGAGRLARGGVSSATGVVAEISGETKDFVADTIFGVAQGTSGIILHTTPAISRAVVRTIRNSRNAQSSTAKIGRDAVEKAIVAASASGVSSEEAASAAVDGAVEAVVEIGGDLQDATHATIGGVVSGVSAAQGDVLSATKDAAFALVSSDIVDQSDTADMETVAHSVVDTAIEEAQNVETEDALVITAAATGVVEAAYRVGEEEGDQVRRSVVEHLTHRGLTLAPHLGRHLAELADALSDEMPHVRAAWRGKSMYKAVRLVLDNGGIDLAASLAFFTVMSLLPLLALTIMGLVAIGSVDGTPDILAGALDYLFPASSDLINEAIDNLLGGSLTIGLIAAISLVIGANGLFAAANRATNRVFGVDSSKVVQVTIKNVLLVTVLVVLFLVSVGMTSVIQVMLQISEEFASTAERLSLVAVIVFGALATILPAIYTTVVFAFIYARLPNASVEWRDATFGAIIAIVLFEIGKHIFFWFNNQASYRSSVYGPISSVVVLMLWAYIASLIFLYGAALTKSAGELRPK